MNNRVQYIIIRYPFHPTGIPGCLSVCPTTNMITQKNIWMDFVISKKLSRSMGLEQIAYVFSTVPIRTVPQRA